MRVAAIATFALGLAGSAAAQLGAGTSSPPELGKTATSSGGANDSFRPGAGWSRLYDANGHMREQDYRAMLVRRIAEAQTLVGQPLTDRDRKKIRSAMRADFIAWRKQYDPRTKDYGVLHDRWIVDEAALSPEAWAKQRVDWLNAQQQWILANFGEIEGKTARAR
jgi:hypothetical protein